MKKWFFLCAVLLAACGSVKAQTYGYLTFRSTDGTETSLASEGLKITFADGNLVAVNSANASFTASLSKLSWLQFSQTEAETTAIGSVEAATAGVASEPAAIYTAGGQRLGTRSTGALPAGVYIVKHRDGRTSKLLKQ